MSWVEFRLDLAKFRRLFNLLQGKKNSHHSQGVVRSLSIRTLERWCSYGTIEYWTKAIRTDPREASFYAARAITYAYLGDDAKAHQDLERAADLGFDRASLEQEMGDMVKRSIWLGNA